MSISIVVGGQFGSEGKGKVAYYFAKKFNAVAVVRVGGCNSGHTVIDRSGNKFILRILPTAAIEPNIVSILPSGCYIDLDVLKEEITLTGIQDEDLKIDPYAVIIDDKMKEDEEKHLLREKIGSTLSGTGEAVVKRISRIDKMLFAKDVEQLKKYICETKSYMRSLMDDEKHIIIEGTQGFGLSPINSTYYPYCTSRDTTAAGFLMETGLSPLDVKNVIMAIRTYPIRVSGNSGPLKQEIEWSTVTNRAKSNLDLTELTSVTQKVRRVAEFDEELVIKAINVNKPNIIVMNHLDYINYDWHECTKLNTTMQKTITEFENKIGKKIDYVGVNENTIIANEL